MSHLHKQDLIENFLNGNLTSLEDNEFQNLQANDSSFQEDIDFFKRFVNVLRVYGQEELKKELIFVEVQVQKEENSALTKMKEGLQKVVKKLHYSIEELTELFRVVPEYQGVLAYVNRGNNLQVLHPQNSIDASIEGLGFKLKTNDKPLIQLTIENNQKQVIYSTTIDSQTSEFVVGVEELIPGRYYWKLTTQKETVIREFFIRKDLMTQ